MQITSRLSWHERILTFGIVSLFVAFTLHHMMVPSYDVDSTISVSLKSEAWIEVEIKGAVYYPGRYLLLKGTTIEELFIKAKPFEHASLSKFKLNKVLKAGQEITIPIKHEKSPRVKKAACLPQDP